MPKYWGKQSFSLGSFPKWVKSKRHKRKRKKKRVKIGMNNGQLRFANATSGGALKLPGPTNVLNIYSSPDISLFECNKHYNLQIEDLSKNRK